ncbi:hypothetical protein [Pseudoalteromonas sp. ASV78]|uniref:hypothetical protein n=1 Tax=Pseudoalteromonas sp. ASV78 TaxID=3397851 RepID=UPI0039FDB59D
METVNKILSWLGECFKVEEDKALHENKLFWVVVLVPLFFITWISWRLSEELITKGLYNPHVSAESLASFVNYYAFPIALLTVPLTLAVMINRFHSSKQKAKTNRLIEQNNTANNFYTHYKYFREHCESIIEKQSIEIDIDIFYNFIFPEANVSRFSTHLNPKFIELLEKELEKLNQRYQKYSELPYEDPYKGKMYRASTPFKGELKAFSHKFEFYGLVKGIYINKDKKECHLTQYNEELKKTYDSIVRILSNQGVSSKEEAIDFIKKLSINMKS